MRNRVFTNGLVKLWLIVGLLLGTQLIFAQDELEEGMETADNTACKPDNFTTPYEKFQSDSIQQKQIQIWYSFGQEEFKHEQYKKAIPYYWKVLVNDPAGTYKVVYSKLAACYFDLTQKDEENKTAYLDSTLLIIYRGLETYPDYPTLHYRAGSIFRALGRTECAIPHYEALVLDKPDEKSYLSILSRLYFQVDDERAIEMQQKVTEVDPDDAKEAEFLIQLYNHFGKDPLKIMEDLYLKNPADEKVAMRYGKEAVLVGEFEKAVAPLKSVLTAEAKNVEAMNLLAQASEGLGKTNDAIEQYKAILNIDPANIDVLCNIAIAYIQLNQYGNARSHVLQAKRIDSNAGRPYMVMGDILENAVNYCSNQRGSREITYDDKLVYEKAGDEYRKAMQDPKFKGQASERLNQLRNNGFFRTKEEIFIKNKREQIVDDCLKNIAG